MAEGSTAAQQEFTTMTEHQRVPANSSWSPPTHLHAYPEMPFGGPIAGRRSARRSRYGALPAHLQGGAATRPGVLGVVHADRDPPPRVATPSLVSRRDMSASTPLKNALGPRAARAERLHCDERLRHGNVTPGAGWICAAAAELRETSDPQKGGSRKRVLRVHLRLQRTRM